MRTELGSFLRNGKSSNQKKSLTRCARCRNTQYINILKYFKIVKIVFNLDIFMSIRI